MPRAQTFLAVTPFAAIVLISVGSAASAQTIWTGFGTSFSKALFADPSLPQNQDCITASICLTRGTQEGLYNRATETGYTPTSPAGTEWATDLILANSGKTIAATNWADLSFTNWVDAYGGMGSRMLPTLLTSRSAVLRLINEINDNTDDIYLDIRFTQWTGTGGGFAYERATEPVQPPTTTGDYNQDGIVDAADYVVWRDSVDQTVSPAGSGADGDASGTVDPADYEFWRARFGNIVPDEAHGAVTAVPEPSSASVVLAGLFGLRLCCARRRRPLDW